MPTHAIVGVLVLALLAAACGSDAPPAAGPDEDGTSRAPDERGGDPGSPGPDGFDRDTAEDRAQSLLGLPEEAVEEDAETRIVRRGDEHLPGTMDLRPGRRNLELDDDGSGTFVVTRVTVEVPDGEDPLVVE